MFNYADYDYISVNHKELKLVCDAPEVQGYGGVVQFKFSAGKSVWISGHSV